MSVTKRGFDYAQVKKSLPTANMKLFYRSPETIQSNRILAFKASGFTLIELLVALAITAIGLAGVLQLQYKQLQHYSQLQLASAANSLANDLEELVRSEAMTCSESGCELPIIAAAEFNQWKARVDETLPNSKFVVTPQRNGYQLQLTWGDSDTEKSCPNSSQLHCINTEITP